MQTKMADGPSKGPSTNVFGFKEDKVERRKASYANRDATKVSTGSISRISSQLNYYEVICKETLHLVICSRKLSNNKTNNVANAWK